MCPPGRLDADRDMMQSAEDLPVRADIEAGKIEERQQVCVANVEEEMRGARIVAVFNEFGQWEFQQLLIKAHGALDVAAHQRGVVQSPGRRGGAGPPPLQKLGADAGAAVLRKPC